MLSNIIIIMIIINLGPAMVKKVGHSRQTFQKCVYLVHCHTKRVKKKQQNRNSNSSRQQQQQQQQLQLQHAATATNTATATITATAAGSTATATAAAAAKAAVAAVEAAAAAAAAAEGLLVGGVVFGWLLFSSMVGGSLCVNVRCTRVSYLAFGCGIREDCRQLAQARHVLRKPLLVIGDLLNIEIIHPLGPLGPLGLLSPGPMCGPGKHIQVRKTIHPSNPSGEGRPLHPSHPGGESPPPRFVQAVAIMYPSSSSSEGCPSKTSKQ
eukprot:12429442-Karenia_brevis.AAC.1